MLKKEDLKRVTATILITGETGTGKSSLAHWIANEKNKNLVEVNLAGLSENLIESELFGHKKGAFTGASEDKKGYLDLVQDGVLFLDEVGELPLQAQKKLLQLLEDKTYYPVGSPQKKHFKGQLIVATHRNLSEMVMQKEFRQDLFFRLQVFHFELKPLRDNPINILKMASELISYHFKRPEISLSQEVKDLFLSYQWPGNFRELKHCLEYALLFSDDFILLEQLPDWVKLENLNHRFIERMPEYAFALEQFERQYLKQAMEFYSGKINQCSMELKISKVTLINKLKKYQINSVHFRAKKRDLELAS
ncbi:MAG: sigma 54-interacting transcriptional regulator [Bacteriovoracaceae bacterium]